MDAIERVEIPTGVIRIPRCVRRVITSPDDLLYRDLPIGLEVVGAEEQFRAGGEKDVSVLQNATERNVLCVGKRHAERPCVAIVFGQEDLPVPEPEGFIVPLRIDVWTCRREAIPEVVVFTNRSPCAAERMVGLSKPPTVTAVA